MPILVFPLLNIWRMCLFKAAAASREGQLPTLNDNITVEISPIVGRLDVEAIQS